MVVLVAEHAVPADGDEEAVPADGEDADATGDLSGTESSEDLIEVQVRSLINTKPHYVEVIGRRK